MLEAIMSDNVMFRMKRIYPIKAMVHEVCCRTMSNSTLVFTLR